MPSTLGRTVPGCAVEAQLNAHRSPIGEVLFLDLCPPKQRPRGYHRSPFYKRLAAVQRGEKFVYDHSNLRTDISHYIAKARHRTGLPLRYRVLCGDNTKKLYLVERL